MALAVESPWGISLFGRSHHQAIHSVELTAASRDVTTVNINLGRSRQQSESDKDSVSRAHQGEASRQSPVPTSVPHTHEETRLPFEEPGAANSRIPSSSESESNTSETLSVADTEEGMIALVSKRISLHCSLHSYEFGLL